MGFPRQEYWTGLLFPSPGDIPDPGIEPASPPPAGRFFTPEPPGSPPLKRSVSVRHLYFCTVHSLTAFFCSPLPPSLPFICPPTLFLPSFFFSASVNIYQCLRWMRYCTGNMYWKRQNFWSGSALHLCEKQVCQLESRKLGSNSPGYAGVCYTKWRPGTNPAHVQMTRSPTGETAEFHLKKVDENNGYTKLFFFFFFPGKLANEIQCQGSNLVQEACG